MYEPEENKAEVGADENSVNTQSSSEASEYSFRKEEIYSDAHYEPAGTSTKPPRYYTPPERPVKEPKPKKQKSKSVWPGVVALCLVFALLGGLLGAAIADRRMDQKLSALQESMNASVDEKVAEASKAAESLYHEQLVAPGTANGVLSGAQVFEQAKEQVVGISTEVTYQNFFGMTTSAAVSGSGFIISEDGYILTNYHVIETANANDLDVTVMLYDGTEYTAAIVGYDAGNDVALLKIEATDLSPVTMGNSDAITMGETVYAVGNPLGELAYSMSTGTVSGLDRVIATEDAPEGINMFQIDAAVNHGNSGGPVYNSLGEVIGIVTAKSGETDAEGLGFAIPINDAASIANDLITKGYVTGKAYMGVRLDERYNSMYAQYYNMPLGAYVYSVDKDSAAEKAGLQAGDIITKMGDTEVSSYTELKSAVRSFSAGDTTEITVYRAGESLTLTITFDEQKPAEPVDDSNMVLDPFSSENH